MILALKYVSDTDAYMGYEASGKILLCETENEEEAFAEMRRFLEINHISSNITYVKVVESHEYAGRIVPRHKEVYMSLKGCPPYNRTENKDIKFVAFGVYCDSDCSKEKLGIPEDWRLCEETDLKTNKTYICVKRYLDDLTERKAGGR